MPVLPSFRPIRLCIPLCALAAVFLPVLPVAAQARGSTHRQSTAAGSSAADTSPQPLAGSAAVTTDTYHVRGVVLDSHTGKPIARALVQAFGERIATFTDHNGRFALDVRFTGSGADSENLQRAMVNQQVLFLGLNARKPGYTGSNRTQSLQLVPMSALQQDLVLKLTPSAAIEGHIAAAGDDHPESVQVSLFFRRIQDGLGNWNQISQTATNSRGEYRFGDLQPGEYRLLTREYSDAPAQRQEFDKPVTRYAPVHFPAGSTATSGPAIHLAAGENLQANLNLRPETFYPVRVSVATPNNANIGIQARVMQGGTPSGFDFRYNPREKLAQGLLPAGTFDLVLHANGPEGGEASVPLAVSGAPLEIPPVTLLPSTSIPVIVHQDFAEKSGTPAVVSTSPSGVNRAPVQLALFTQDMLFTNAHTTPDKNDPTRLNLEQVVPGTYTIQSFAVRGYIASMSSGGTDLLQHPLVVDAGAGTQPIEITLRDDGGTIQGTLDASLLSAEGSASPGAPVAAPAAFLICLPVQLTTARIQQSIVQPQGSFRFFKVPPGTYRIFASHQPFDQVEYRSEAWLKANASKGASVTVEPGNTAAVNLTSILDEEP